ncbi:MAG: hypothetical protein ACPL1I_09900 [bacterium]
MVSQPRHLGISGYYTLLILYRFPRIRFDMLYAFLRGKVTRRAVTLFIQHHSELIHKEKDTGGFYNLYSLTSEGRRLLEEEFLKNETLRLDLKRLEGGKWHE